MTSQPFTILMADDDMEDLELMEDAMRGYSSNILFHKVYNGKAVLEYLASKPHGQLPRLIILDYNMPELNGSQVLSELNKDRRYHHIPKIIFSTSNAPAHIKEGKNNGATEYFVKPTNMKDLDQIVQKLMSYCAA